LAATAEKPTTPIIHENHTKDALLSLCNGQGLAESIRWSAHKKRHFQLKIEQAAGTEG
jgi:hypothetical protein